MKLVEIKHQEEECQAPQPLVMLPLSSWTSRYDSDKVVELSQDLLKGIRHKQLRVVIDELDFEKLDHELFVLLREISSCRPGMTLVGPSVDDVVSWVVSGASEKRQGERFEDLLQKMRRAGLGRLMPASMVDVLKSVRDAGFPASLVTNISEYGSPLELAKELLRVNDISREQPIDVWVPAYDYGMKARSSTQNPALDFQLLRVLAVGTLCLNAIPYRRASTRYFSMDAIEFSRYCGANDFGFGAVNELTARTMHLERLERLKRAVKPARAAGAGRSQSMPCYFPEA
jgi:hypothetical protein